MNSTRFCGSDGHLFRAGQSRGKKGMSFLIAASRKRTNAVRRTFKHEPKGGKIEANTTLQMKRNSTCPKKQGIPSDGLSP